ncbi:hypothetical protein ACFPOE_23650 [Caenimonas terrae]|uniref:Uncharacterized protein n=1 Tax=Caenimonas terrae TaxID=696074 RepID=A0ABW0NN05_9BURK
MQQLRFISRVRLLALAILLVSPALRAQGVVPEITAGIPAQVEGRWCGAGFLSGTILDLIQHYQDFEGMLMRGDRKRPVDGRIEGRILRTSRESSGRAGELVLELDGDRLRIVRAGGPLRPTQGMSFVRAGGGDGC